MIKLENLLELMYAFDRVLVIHYYTCETYFYGESREIYESGSLDMYIIKSIEVLDNKLLKVEIVNESEFEKGLDYD